ncbi:hypothetical protein [Rhizobium sp. LC145]|uniref:hypothetical protein n=1 Tax=Rhizobium sp. LC145 TaxID=1120688 RepID=UPI00062A0A5A|nr:hypothetical protein [Rhizobium sp. LC145]KKX28253.1 hypothetical protein YH62_19400 [Rhizobium sp. LC145]TKT58326.1 hypothetical protein FDR95_12005 [Rhizobiaceae bacterium LC148]
MTTSTGILETGNRLEVAAAAISQLHAQGAIPALTTKQVLQVAEAVLSSISPNSENLLQGGVLDALRRAERFMCGFEGDELQEGLDADLSAVREAIGLMEASNEK